MIVSGISEVVGDFGSIHVIFTFVKLPTGKFIVPFTIKKKNNNRHHQKKKQNRDLLQNMSLFPWEEFLFFKTLKFCGCPT